MTSLFAARSERVAVLAADPDLARALDHPRRARAEPVSVARVLRRRVGVWQTTADAHEGRDGFGLLVLRGLLVRRVGLRGRQGAELLSVGDVLQPSQHDGEAVTLPIEATWRVLSELQVAVIDLDWVRRMAPYPEVSVELTRRVMARSRRLASMLAIDQHHRLDDRLRLLFWELADRYGHVGPEGVTLDLRLTHELIGHLAAAQRPSVSAAVARLERGGYLARTARGWLLLGPAPSVEDLVADDRPASAR